MVDVGLFYVRLVKELIVYLPRGFNDVGSVELENSMFVDIVLAFIPPLSMST